MPSCGEKRKGDAGDRVDDDEQESASAGTMDEDGHEKERQPKMNVQSEPDVDNDHENQPARSSRKKIHAEAYKDVQKYVILPPAPAPPPEVRCGWDGCTQVVSRGNVAAGVEHWRTHFVPGSSKNQGSRYRCKHPDCGHKVETWTYSPLERHWVRDHFGITWRCPVANCDMYHEPLTRRDAIAQRRKIHEVSDSAVEPNDG